MWFAYRGCEIVGIITFSICCPNKTRYKLKSSVSIFLYRYDIILLSVVVRTRKFLKKQYQTIRFWKSVTGIKNSVSS